MLSEHWKEEPEDQDYPAAKSYLSLLMTPAAAAKIVKSLKKSSSLEHFMSKDILRASGLALLPKSNPEIARDLEKVKNGVKLSPVLLVRGEPLWIADGYHRVCTSYYIDEKAEIPCRVVGRDG